MQVSPRLQKAVNDFITLANDRSKYDAAKNKTDTYYTYAAEKPGQKYWRITMQLNVDLGDKCRSVYCFVDEEGNIYKDASWYRPAKHVRGNVFNANPLQGTGIYGVDYLR